MTNWRLITSAPKDGQVLLIRRLLAGRTVHEGSAVWRAATAYKPEGWIDHVTGNPLPAPTHWKAFGRGHPE